MASKGVRAAEDLEKRQLADELSERWPYSKTAILVLLNRLDKWGADWRRPHYVLKMAKDSGIDLDEFAHLASPI